MHKKDLVILVVVGIYLVVHYSRTARANYERNREISNVIVSDFFSVYKQGSAGFIATIINRPEADVEAALRFLLGLHRVRIEVNQYRKPQWVLVNGQP